MMHRIVMAWAATAALAILCPPARAQDEALNRAREHFDRGQTLYAAGKYADASEQFQRAFAVRPFPQFLFNIGACREKMRDYQGAIGFYERYLEADREAPDRRRVEGRIEVLRKEVERIKALGAAPPPPDGAPATVPATGAAAPGQQPSAAVAALDEVAPRGLVVVESDPPGAFVYLDDKKKRPVGKTPWQGSLEGQHNILIERKGYKPAQRAITPDERKMILVVFPLAQEDYLGWIDVKANIPGADVYIDDKAAGAYRKTPFSGNMAPGKHKIWVTADGYDEYFREIEVVPGETYTISAVLRGTPVGYLHVRGRDAEYTRISVDGVVLCERGPCRRPLPQGRHRLVIERDGYKTYSRDIEVQARSEMDVQARMVPHPSRSDAVWAYVFAGVFAGGGVFLGLQARSVEDELAADRASGPPPDSRDPRLLRGKLFAIGADVAYAIAGVSLVTAIYYTVRDKGPPSTALTESRTLSVGPALGPGFAGLDLGVSW